LTALARELMAFLTGAGSPEPNQPGTPALAQLLRDAPALGIRRAILISLQLATELDLASASGQPLAPITLESVRVERLGTPFEQALLPRATSGERTLAESLAELGALVATLLEHERSYLERSLWSAGFDAQPRRADRELLGALRRALALIGEHCRGGSARYTNAFDVVADLAKLASIATRVVQKRHAAPIVAVHRPPPRSKTKHRRLPKVLICAKAR
jgi:hypothetical protein